MTLHSRLTIEEYDRIRTVLENMLSGYTCPDDMSNLSVEFVMGHKEGYTQALKAAINIIREEC